MCKIIIIIIMCWYPSDEGDLHCIDLQYTSFAFCTPTFSIILYEMYMKEVYSLIDQYCKPSTRRAWQYTTLCMASRCCAGALLSHRAGHTGTQVKGSTVVALSRQRSLVDLQNTAQFSASHMLHDIMYAFSTSTTQHTCTQTSTHAHTSTRTRLYTHKHAHTQHYHVLHWLQAVQ